MAKPTATEYERLLDLSTIMPDAKGYGLWKVHIDCLREADKNARQMNSGDFERLGANIQKSGGLAESFPLCYLTKSVEGNNEFRIISGHHRIRAAVKRGFTTLVVIVIERELTNDEILEKQLSHNRLNGFDDNQILLELVNQIENPDSKLATGITSEDLERMKASVEAMGSVNIDEMEFSLDFEKLEMLFLPHQMENWNKVIDQLDEESKGVMVAAYDTFAQVSEIIRTLSKRDNIRNVSTIMARMCEITQLWLAEHPAPVETEEKKAE